MHGRWVVVASCREGNRLPAILTFVLYLLIDQACAIGRSSKTVREFLEKNHEDGMTKEQTIRLAIKSLLEVVQTGAKNIEIALMEGHGVVRNLELAEIEAVVKEIETEREAEAERRRTRLAATAGAQASMGTGGGA